MAGLLAAVVLLAPARADAQSAADPEGYSIRRDVPEVTAAHALAVTANPYATQAALRVLRDGGNAVDAAVTAQFVLNVVEPQSSGLGGGGFLLLRTAAGRVVTLDGREEAPAAATPELFLRPDGTPVPFFPERITGGRAVGVPGLPALMALALERYGTYTLARALAPAIELADEGFPVTPRLATGVLRHMERLARFPATRAVFFDRRRAGPLRVGDTLRQPDLAATFRLLGREGVAAFYRGAIARDIVAAVRQAPVSPGVMTLEDLAGYRAVERAPVVAAYRGYVLYGMGPPSSGASTVFQLLGLLATRPALEGEALDVANVHRFVQAARLAYADRGRYLADADFVDVPLQGLLDAGYLTRRSAAIDWPGPPAPVEPGRPPGWQGALPGVAAVHESPSTTHVTIADAQGMIVSMTTTIEQGFGSGIVVPGRGFLLNNELTDFAARPVDAIGNPVANRVEGGRRPRRTALDAPESLGGKRPRSSMAPTLVLKDGRPWLALGSPGGSRIIQYVAEVLTRMMDHGMTLQAAIEAPHATHLGTRTDLEPALEASRLPALLEARGHTVRLHEQTSGLHGIWWPGDGRLHAGVDPRREGEAAGY